MKLHGKAIITKYNRTIEAMVDIRRSLYGIAFWYGPQEGKTFFRLWYSLSNGKHGTATKIIRLSQP